MYYLGCRIVLKTKSNLCFLDPATSNIQVEILYETSNFLRLLLFHGIWITILDMTLRYIKIQFLIKI